MTSNLKPVLRSSVMAFSIAALTCTVPVFAQMAGGGAQASPQQGAQTAPSQQQAPGQQAGQVPGAQNQQQSMMMDDSFVKKAIEGSNAQVQLGQLAQQKATSEDVKQFAARMVQDHTKLEDVMNKAAQKLNVKPPKGVDGKDKSLMKKLQAASGQDFDSMYIEAMIKGHKQDLKEFQSEAQNGQSPGVKDLAGQGAKMIQQHLEMATQLAQAHNLPTDGKDKMKSGQ